MDKDAIAKVICYALGFYIAYQIFMYLLPYLVMFLALAGAGFLYLEYQKNKRRKF